MRRNRPVRRALRSIGRGLDAFFDLDAIFLTALTLGLLRVWRSDRVPLAVKWAATLAVVGVIGLFVWAELAG